MNNNELRKLAGLVTLTEKKGDGAVKEMMPMDDVFGKKAGAMCKALMKMHDGDVSKAMKALKKAPKGVNAEEVAKAMEMMKAKEMKESIYTVRRMAGLPVIREKDEMDMDDEGDMDAKAPAKGDKEEKEEDDMPKIVVALAKKMAKKFGVEKEEDVDGLADMILKVYDAGMKDAEKGDKEEVKEDLAAAKAEIHHVMMGNKMVMKGKKEDCMAYCAKNKGAVMKKGMPMGMKEDGPVPVAGVPGLERQAGATAAATNNAMGQDHKQDMDFDPAKGVKGADVVHKEGGVDVLKLIKNLHSVHETEGAARAAADKLNSSIGQMHGEDKKYDLAYCVHCMPKM